MPMPTPWKLLLVLSLSPLITLGTVNAFAESVDDVPPLVPSDSHVYEFVSLPEPAATTVVPEPEPQSQPPPRATEPAPRVTSNSDPGAFLSCVRDRESKGDYSIHNTQGSGASGAYQFMQGTWNSTASSVGRDDLVGTDPAAASPADQDAMAAALYAMQGSSPWGGACG